MLLKVPSAHRMVDIQCTCACTRSFCKGQDSGHTRNIILLSEQSVDGIYFARQPEVYNTSLVGHAATTSHPRTPELNVDPGNIYSIREDPLVERFQHWAGGLGGGA